MLSKCVTSKAAAARFELFDSQLVKVSAAAAVTAGSASTIVSTGVNPAAGTLATKRSQSHNTKAQAQNQADRTH